MAIKIKIEIVCRRDCLSRKYTKALSLELQIMDMDKNRDNILDDYAGLTAKVQRYKQILTNTKEYRERWSSGLKDLIISELETMIKVTAILKKLNFI